MLIGIASIDITPPVGVTMVGYNNRISNKVGHRLRAEAMVVEGDGKQWALITSDMIGYPKRYVDPICQAIAKTTGIDVDAIIVSGTHTHSGPATITIGSKEQNDLDRKYLSGLVERLVEVVKLACDDKQPAKLESAKTFAPLLGHNRRVENAEGQWVNQWDDPNGLHTGFYDPTIMLTAVRREDGRCDALLVNYGCHPVMLGADSLDISADYVGYMKDRIEVEADVGTVMFVQAGGGNIDPRVCLKKGFEHPKKLGEEVADIVLEAMGKLKAAAGGKVASCRQPWVMTRTRDAIKRVDIPGGNTGDVIETNVTAARMGDVRLIAIPGELFSEFNERLREISGFPTTLVVTLANDYIGYIPTDEGQEQGAYETKMAPCMGMEESLMACAGKALGEI